MKVLLILLAFFGVAHAEPRYVYRIKAVRPVKSDGLSCGATQRMLKDRHRLVTHDGEVWINGKPWVLDELSTIPGEALISFHVGHGQYTYLAMSLWTNDNRLLGLYQLVGRTPDRRDCSDTVELEGERL